ncbi:ataxia telangiectasia mutated family protein [Tanacetum coccineum]
MGRNKVVGPDEIPIEAWRCLRGEGVRWLTILFNKTLSRAKMPKEWRLSEDMYEGARTCVRMPTRNSEYFPVDVRLHQSLAISPYLFALILDELSRGIQESIPWCLIFADDIVLVSDTPDGLNGRLEQWKEMLENKGLRVSREKTEYMRCDFNKNENDQNEEAVIRIGEYILEPNESFRYLGSVIHKSGRIEDDVTHRIQAGWLKWRAATGILCDKNVPLKLKGKFYRVTIRPTILYGSECWPLTKVQANRMEVAEMKMLREGRLRWFGHVKRRPQSSPVRRVETIVVDDDMTSDRNSWRTRIRVDEEFLAYSFAFVPRVFLHLCAFCAFMLVCPFDHGSVCAYVCLCVSYLYVGMLVLFMPSFPSPLMWSFWVHALLPEVFLEAVPLSLGRGVTVYIPPPPYLALAGLGTVVVVVVFQIDEYISAEIPDPVQDPTGHKVVTNLMMHGPCGAANLGATCMQNGPCSKHFPKRYNKHTFIDTNGHTQYRTRDTRVHVMKGESRLDNCNVIFKGPDRILAKISKPIKEASTSADANRIKINKIQNYVDGRFICPFEAY